MEIKNGTLVAFDSGNLGLVKGEVRIKGRKKLCDVDLIFPRMGGITRDVNITVLLPLGQTQEKRTKDAIGTKTLEHFIRYAERQSNLRTALALYD